MKEEKNNNTADVENTSAQSQQSDDSISELPKKPGAPGPLVGITIIIILLISGGLYFWSTFTTDTDVKNAETTLEGSLSEDIATQNDGSDQIENDLDTFDTTAFEAELEADLEALEAEL